MGNKLTITNKCSNTIVVQLILTIGGGVENTFTIAPGNSVNTGYGPPSHSLKLGNQEIELPPASGFNITIVATNNGTTCVLNQPVITGSNNCIPLKINKIKE